LAWYCSCKKYAGQMQQQVVTSCLNTIIAFLLRMLA